MNKKMILKLLIISSILLISIFSAYKYISLNSNNPKYSNTASTIENSMSKEITFKLFNPNKAAILRPIVHLKLKNGSILTIKDKNPFKFNITASIELLNKFVNYKHTVKVYRISVYKDPDHVFNLAKKLNININKLYFNNVTKTYIYYNATHIFEYNIETGFFRLKLRKLPQVGTEALPSSTLATKAINYLKRLGLLYPTPYTVSIGINREVNGKPAIIAIVVQPKLDGITVTNLAMTVLLTPEGRVIGVEGVIPANISPVASYTLKPLNKALRDLSTYIREGRPMIDWYISWLAFTKLDIKNIKLTYYVTPDLYVVPVYIIKGNYELHYNNVSDKGPIKAIILATGTPSQYLTRR